ncbi:MAG: signal peptidase I [Candidatus Woesearchaeota archaeon]
MDYKKIMKKTWHFIWKDDSIWSWIVNVILAFVLIKYIVYPVLGFMLATSHPVVAVVSGSMEHKMVAPCEKSLKNIICYDRSDSRFELCGMDFEKKQRVNLDFYWQTCGEWYAENFGINQDQFSSFEFKRGFNTGDIMVLKGQEPGKIQIGDVVVYKGSRPDPIIHRVVRKYREDGEWFFQTKGDHNPDSNFDEKRISESQLIGKAFFRIPLLGWIKIWFVRLVQLVIP